MFYLLIKTLRFALFILDFCSVLLFTFTCSFLPTSINKYFMHGLFRLMCKSFLNAIGGQVHIHQKNRAALPKHFLLIANHPSGYDILLLNSIFKVYPLAQSGVRKWFFFGRIAKAIGTVFVDRSDKSSKGVAKQACLDGLLEGKSILIYPEGGCFGKDLRDFKYGAFNLSMESQVPILPIYLQYEAENSFEWGNESLPWHLFNIFKAKNKHVHCYIFDAVHPQHFKDAAQLKDYMHRMYQKWQQLYRIPDEYDELPISIPEYYDSPVVRVQ